MPYYETIDKDLERAKAILAEGRATLDTPIDESWLPTKDASARLAALQGGAIYGKDIYAAYKLLESFVEEIERLRREPTA